MKNIWRMLNRVAKLDAQGYSVFYLYPENHPAYQVQACYQ